MKIALAQIESETGNVAANINRHVRAVEQAAAHQSNLVIFPELSLTGYAPELAKRLAMPIDDVRLSTFQTLSTKRQITIGLGLPVKTDDKPQIGLLLFEPEQLPALSGKQYLHEDELPDFSHGLNYHGRIAKRNDMALAICYELSVEEHAEQAHQRNAAIYLASAAKTVEGVEKASARLSEISRKYSMLSLLCNCVGTCEGLPAGGQSAIWDSNGKLIRQLNGSTEALLIVETEMLHSEVIQL